MNVESVMVLEEPINVMMVHMYVMNLIVVVEVLGMVMHVPCQIIVCI